ncbi:MAG: FAD-dependent oxidoreductase [Alphaproteobacteria bacterium]
MADLNVDICVIGAGSGGLSVAAGASQLGRKVVLIEKHKMGGDCLNYGCVPSKALLAAAKAAHRWEGDARYGLTASAPGVDFAAVQRHVQGVIAAIAPVDSVARYEGLGVQVIQAAGRFVGPDRVEAGGDTITARRFVIATGSTPFVPPLPGLDQVPCLTNESVFELTECPGHLIVVGGGPIGMELAQAHRRLGAKVTVVEMATPLPKDDPELATLVIDRLRREGVDILPYTRVTGVAGTAGDIRVTVEDSGGAREIIGTHLLMAVGRRPNLDGLGLEAAGVETNRAGIVVDGGLRTSNKKIFAVGDVAGGPQFTHVAGYHAGIVIRRALFRLPATVNYTALPWVTYTDPELAHVGMTELQARNEAGDIRVLRWPFAENDRAIAERDTDGFVKVITSPGGKVLGCTIVGTGAGDLLQPWTLAISAGLKISKMAGAIAPYPTRSEAGKRAAGSYFLPGLFSARTRKIVAFLARFG